MAMGVSPSRLRVLPDRAPDFRGSTESGAPPTAPPIIVMPCSFHADEPIAEVLAAAERCPDASFILTGRYRDEGPLNFVKWSPPNVSFSGFLPVGDFDRLLLSATAILCLTTEDGIQLSSAAEAMAAAKPMIVSDTPLLRELLQPAGIFVDNTAASIARACQYAIAHSAERATARRTSARRRSSAGSPRPKSFAARSRRVDGSAPEGAAGPHPHSRRIRRQSSRGAQDFVPREEMSTRRAHRRQPPEPCDGREEASSCFDRGGEPAGPFRSSCLVGKQPRSVAPAMKSP